jgi:hypothetical protein
VVSTSASRRLLVEDSNDCQQLRPPVCQKNEANNPALASPWPSSSRTFSADPIQEIYCLYVHFIGVLTFSQFACTNGLLLIFLLTMTLTQN